MAGMQTPEQKAAAAACGLPPLSFGMTVKSPEQGATEVQSNMFDPWQASRHRWEHAAAADRLPCPEQGTVAGPSPTMHGTRRCFQQLRSCLQRRRAGVPLLLLLCHKEHLAQEVCELVAVNAAVGAGDLVKNEVHGWAGALRSTVRRGALRGAVGAGCAHIPHFPVVRERRSGGVATPVLIMATGWGTQETRGSFEWRNCQPSTHRLFLTACSVGRWPETPLRQPQPYATPTHPAWVRTAGRRGGRRSWRRQLPH
jgi:hypothetical protein